MWVLAEPRIQMRLSAHRLFYTKIYYSHWVGETNINSIMTENLSPKEWLADNPSKSLNDYYNQFPQKTSSTISKPSREVQTPSTHSQKSDYRSSAQDITYFPKKKSMALSIALTIVLGPFGLFYISSFTALTMIFFPVMVLILYTLTEHVMDETIILLRMFFLSSSVVILLCYMPICVLIAIYKTHKYNQNEDQKMFNSRY
jgi:hypothetical protein